MKKFLSVILCAIMILPAIPITVGAERGTRYGDYLYYEKYYDYIEITGCEENATSVDIPAEIDGLPVTEIGDGAFMGCESLTSVTISDGITSIGLSAFEGCGSLTSVTIPSSTTSIGDYAFKSCYGLMSVTIKTGVISIGNYAFAWCENLTNVTIPSGVTNIGNFAFNDCYGLVSITVDNQNQYYCSIDGNLFDKNKKTLIQYAIGKQDSQYIIPNGVTGIGNGAFESCESLTSVTIPNSVTSIGDGAFSGCNNITSVTIPDSVKSIGEGAFYDCDSLTSVTIPDSVTSIGDEAFNWCGSLMDVYYSGNEADWQRIDIGDYNDYLTRAVIHYNSGTDTETTKFAGMPTVSAGNGAYTVSATLQNIDKSCVMITALYNGRKLAGVKIINLSNGQTSAAAAVSAGQADTAKVFIWESIDGMKPLCEPKTITIK